MSSGAFDVIRDRIQPRLLMALSSAVPLWAHSMNGWTPERIFDRSRLEVISSVIAEKGDVLQFGGKGCAEAFNHFAEGIARLSYCPGGVRFCGIRWEYEIGRWPEGKHGVLDDDGSSPNSIGQLFDPSRFPRSEKE